MKEKNLPIDIFLTWVDGNDPAWLEEKEYYERNLKGKQISSADKERYRSWDNLQYIFRGIEQCMPWVRKVFFVTWGHIPHFLNTENPKLEIVKHEDFIPREYLPTFNSNVIEMNLHRIKGLSENFIIFNDDTFPIKYVDEKYYFRNNKVCDEAVERTLNPKLSKSGSEMVYYFYANNIMVLNKYFSKREVQKKHFWKWFYPGYGKKLLRNIALHYFYDFDNFTNPHVPSAMKKSTLKKIWDLEPELLDNASRNRFRNYTDLTQYLIRYWQLCEGDFYPRRTRGKFYKVNPFTYKNIAQDIRNRKYDMISINEDGRSLEWEDSCVKIQSEINSALDEIFPNKSSFEL